MPPNAVEGGRRERRRRVVVDDVGAHEQRRSPRSFATASPAVDVHVRDHHRGTLGGERPRVGLADPAGRAGDDGDLVVEPVRHDHHGFCVRPAPHADDQRTQNWFPRSMSSSGRPDGRGAWPMS